MPDGARFGGWQKESDYRNGAAKNCRIASGRTARSKAHASGNKLPAGQPVCFFAIELSTQARVQPKVTIVSHLSEHEIGDIGAGTRHWPKVITHFRSMAVSPAGWTVF
jgi:hypothetical protein